MCARAKREAKWSEVKKQKQQQYVNSLCAMYEMETHVFTDREKVEKVKR